MGYVFEKNKATVCGRQRLKKLYILWAIKHLFWISSQSCSDSFQMLVMFTLSLHIPFLGVIMLQTSFYIEAGVHRGHIVGACWSSWRTAIVVTWFTLESVWDPVTLQRSTLSRWLTRGQLIPGSEFTDSKLYAEYSCRLILPPWAGSGCSKVKNEQEELQTLNTKSRLIEFTSAHINLPLH